MPKKNIGENRIFVESKNLYIFKADGNHDRTCFFFFFFLLSAFTYSQSKCDIKSNLTLQVLKRNEERNYGFQELE